MLREGLANSFCERSQIINTFGFAGQAASVTTIQLCSFSTRTPQTIHNWEGTAVFPSNFVLKNQGQLVVCRLLIQCKETMNQVKSFPSVRDWRNGSFGHLSQNWGLFGDEAAGLAGSMHWTSRGLRSLYFLLCWWLHVCIHVWKFIELHMDTACTSQYMKHRPNVVHFKRHKGTWSNCGLSI